jgi:hypothetical protein
MTYKLSTKGNKLEVSLNKTEVVTKVEKNEYAVSLARTGGQGTRGTSISNVYIDANKNLMVETITADGVVSTINAGSISAAEQYSLSELLDVNLEDLQDGDVIIYNDAVNEFRNYQLTTAKVVDIDNSNKADGALLVYNGTNDKYTATTTLQNPNTIITGGHF